MRVLVLGASGLLGSAIFRYFSMDQSLKTFGTIRSAGSALYFDPRFRSALISDIHLESEADLSTSFLFACPDVVVNCVGIIKQHPISNDHLSCLEINASLPHRLAKFCSIVGARLIHFSTDCVFSGKDGPYREDDFPDAHDLYGRTKCLGEVDYGDTVTLRTSIIGHELASSRSLVDWFLRQSGEVKGFRKAIFSGLPATEVARIVRELVLENTTLRGIYHLSADPISKYELLRLIAEIYEKSVVIVPDDEVVIDRTLISDRFRSTTEFEPKHWSQMLSEMHRCHYYFEKAAAGWETF